MRKVYGQSRIENCPFCGKRALCVNRQGIPVCDTHKGKYLDIRCTCGSWLEARKGKFGVFFTCINCGTVSLRKALEMADIMQ